MSFKYIVIRDELDCSLTEVDESSEDLLQDNVTSNNNDGLDYLDHKSEEYDHTLQAALFILKAKHIHKISQKLM